MDLSKLTPAPWRTYRHMQPAASNDYSLLAPDGNTYCQSKTDMEFAALARNAFDVMMRRGWHPKRCNDGAWIVLDADGNCVSGVSSTVPRMPDPFTALVEADRWYREHVEGGALR